MRQKFPALLLTLAFVLGLCACGGGMADNAKQAAGGNSDAEEQDDAETVDAQTLKVGLVCPGDESDGYTYNFIRGKNDVAVMLAAEGVNVEWLVKWNADEGGACEDANRELAEDGCQLIFNIAPGFEASMLKAAAEYPDVEFVACGGHASRFDSLPNTHNAFANIHEGRYLAGVVGGLKLQELIDNGELAPEEAVIGYVSAPGGAEVVSGYTAYYLGARSVCPSATMKVRFATDADAEEAAASALADMGCKLISQHSDSSAPAAVAQSAGIFHTGYNANLTVAAPGASLVSTRIDWAVYFDHAVRAVLDGGELEQDWSHGMDTLAVELTPLNRDLIADGTDEKLDECKAALADGSLQVFDTSTFTVDGAMLEHCEIGAEEAVFDGAFHESYLQSAPYFALDVDGIEILN